MYDEKLSLITFLKGEDYYKSDIISCPTFRLPGGGGGSEFTNVSSWSSSLFVERKALIKGYPVKSSNRKARITINLTEPEN